MATENQVVEGSQLLRAISGEMVTIFRDFMGKGPERCKTYWAGRDMLVVLLGGGFTVAETTLFEAGRGAAVQDSRVEMQKTLEVRMSEMIERLSGRTIVAFLSATHQDPDLSAEIFVFKPIEGVTPLDAPDAVAG